MSDGNVEHLYSRPALQYEKPVALPYFRHTTRFKLYF